MFATGVYKPEQMLLRARLGRPRLLATGGHPARSPSCRTHCQRREKSAEPGSIHDEERNAL
ncbi:unnamed protein product, partial [Nesidiocoris tenuis]